MRTENREINVVFRLSLKEKEMLERLHSESRMKSISTFIRSQIFRSVRKSEMQTDQNKSLVKELKPIGKNLNQAVKVLNSKKVKFVNRKELNDLKKVIASLQKVVKRSYI